MPEVSSKKKSFSIFETNILFFVLAILFLTVGGYVQSKNILSGLLITEYGLIFIPVLLYAIVRKKDIKSIFRINKIPKKIVLKILAMSALLIPIVALANLLLMWIIEQFSSTIITDLPTAETGIEYLVLMFIISITAGVCEEWFFRGMILNAYETKLGSKWGAIFSGLLFGVFHFNPQNLLGPIILGITFAYLVQITNSIVSGMFAHAANNGISVTMSYIFNIIGQETVVESTSSSVNVLLQSNGTMISIFIVYGFLAFGCFLGVKAILKSISKDYPRYLPGNLIHVNEKTYEIDSIQEEKIYFNDKNGLKVMTKDTLLAHPHQIENVIWRSLPLKITVTEIFPVMLTVVAYGYIIYYAYFL